MRVHRRFAVLAAMLTIPLAVAAAAPAAAEDLCIDATGGIPPTIASPFMILRGFATPGKNKCKQVQGVLVNFESAVSGSACTSFDGGHVTLSLTASFVYEKTGPTDVRATSTIYGVRLYPSTLTGGLVSNNLNGGSTITTFFAYQCKKAFPYNS